MNNSKSEIFNSMHQSNASFDEENDDENDEEKRTLFCANLPDRITEELLYELFLQAGPIESIKIPKDKEGRQRSYGFVTYVHLCTIPYALQLYEGITLFKQKIVVKPKNSGSSSKDNSPLNRLSRRRTFEQSDQLRGMMNNSHNFSDRNMQPVAKRRRQEETVVELMKQHLLNNGFVSQLAPTVFGDILFPKDNNSSSARKSPPRHSNNSRHNSSTPYGRHDNYRNDNKRHDDWYHNHKQQPRRRYR